MIDAGLCDGLAAGTGSLPFERPMVDDYTGNLLAHVERLFGIPVANVDFPGGEGRAAFRVKLRDGRSMIVTRRDDPQRALLEERVMSALFAHNAPVPEVLHFNGVILIQSDEGEDRASERLIRSTNGDPKTDILAGLCESLLHVHESASIAGLARPVPLLGAHGDWVRQLMDRPPLIGRHLGVRAPVPDLDGIFGTLSLVQPEFVKWDARPANAVFSESGTITWIDWEHAGARIALDDMVRVLCDENVPRDERRDNDLVNEFAPRFAASSAVLDPAEYVRIAGMFHFCVRLSLALVRFEDDPDASADALARSDQVGASLPQIVTLCERARDWADHSHKAAVFSPWFDGLIDRLAG